LRSAPAVRAMATNGGNWSNGSQAGLFYLNCNNEASNSNSNIGGRLANGLVARRRRLTGRRPAPSIWGCRPRLGCTREAEGKDQPAAAASSPAGEPRGRYLFFRRSSCPAA
jgi:hypothetical protein